MFPYMLPGLPDGRVDRHGERARFIFSCRRSAASSTMVMIASVLLLLAPQMGLELPKELSCENKFSLWPRRVAGGCSQALFQVPVCIRGYRYRWVSPWRQRNRRDVVRKCFRGPSEWRPFKSTSSSPKLFSFWSRYQHRGHFNCGRADWNCHRHCLHSLAISSAGAGGLAAEKKYPSSGDAWDRHWV